MTPESSSILYTDFEGAIVGLHEVQLLEEFPHERVEQLIALLSDDDKFVSYQAGLILTAWGNSTGLQYLQELVISPSQETHLSPHRLYGYDNAFDEIAHAVSLFGDSRSSPCDSIPMFKILLSKYGDVIFESKLKFALLSIDETSLVPDVRLAIERAIRAKRFYLGSQLLPPLTRWIHDKAVPLLRSFLVYSDDPNPKCNVAESLAFVASREAEELLHVLSTDSDSIVRYEAESALHARMKSSK